MLSQDAIEGLNSGFLFSNQIDPILQRRGDLLVISAQHHVYCMLFCFDIIGKQLLNLFLSYSTQNKSLLSLPFGIVGERS